MHGMKQAPTLESFGAFLLAFQARHMRVSLLGATRQGQ
jgi:hypothetical protein